MSQKRCSIDQECLNHDSPDYEICMINTLLFTKSNHANPLIRKIMIQTETAIPNVHMQLLLLPFLLAFVGEIQFAINMVQ